MRRNVLIVVFILTCLFRLIAPAAADAAQYELWNAIIDQMHIALDNALDAYNRNDADAGKNFVNDAYFGYYEKEGVERAVLSYISGKRASTVEYQFSAVKRLMTDGAPVSEVKASLDSLKRMLR